MKIIVWLSSCVLWSFLLVARNWAWASIVKQKWGFPDATTTPASPRCPQKQGRVSDQNCLACIFFQLAKQAPRLTVQSLSLKVPYKFRIRHYTTPSLNCQCFLFENSVQNQIVVPACTSLTGIYITLFPVEISMLLIYRHMIQNSESMLMSSFWPFCLAQPLVRNEVVISVTHLHLVQRKSIAVGLPEYSNDDWIAWYCLVGRGRCLWR